MTPLRPELGGLYALWAFSSLAWAIVTAALSAAAAAPLVSNPLDLLRFVCHDVASHGVKIFCMCNLAFVLEVGSFFMFTPLLGRLSPADVAATKNRLINLGFIKLVIIFFVLDPVFEVEWVLWAAWYGGVAVLDVMLMLVKRRLEESTAELAAARPKHVSLLWIIFSMNTSMMLGVCLIVAPLDLNFAVLMLADCVITGEASGGAFDTHAHSLSYSPGKMKTIVGRCCGNTKPSGHYCAIMCPSCFFAICALAGLDTLNTLRKYWMLHADSRRGAETPAPFPISTLLALLPSAATDEARADASVYLDTGVECLILLLSLAHYIHVWSQQGLRFSFVDFVLMMHLRGMYLALVARWRRLVTLRNLNRQLDDAFADASMEELIAAPGDPGYAECATEGLHDGTGALSGTPSNAASTSAAHDSGALSTDSNTHGETAGVAAGNGVSGLTSSFFAAASAAASGMSAASKPKSTPSAAASAAQPCRKECSICLEQMMAGKVLPVCKHVFHRACLRRWLIDSHDSCPLCRQGLNPQIEAARAAAAAAAAAAAPSSLASASGATTAPAQAGPDNTTGARMRAQPPGVFDPPDWFRMDTGVATGINANAHSLYGAAGGVRRRRVPAGDPEDWAQNAAEEEHARRRQLLLLQQQQSRGIGTIPTEPHPRTAGAGGNLLSSMFSSLYTSHPPPPPQGALSPAEEEAMAQLTDMFPHLSPAGMQRYLARTGGVVAAVVDAALEGSIPLMTENERNAVRRASSVAAATPSAPAAPLTEQQQNGLAARRIAANWRPIPTTSNNVDTASAPSETPSVAASSEMHSAAAAAAAARPHVLASGASASAAAQHNPADVESAPSLQSLVLSSGVDSGDPTVPIISTSSITGTAVAIPAPAAPSLLLSTAVSSSPAAIVHSAAVAPGAAAAAGTGVPLRAAPASLSLPAWFADVDSEDDDNEIDGEVQALIFTAAASGVTPDRFELCGARIAAMVRRGRRDYKRSWKRRHGLTM